VTTAGLSIVAICSRRTSSPAPSACSETTSPRPRWIHDVAVEAGICNSGSKFGFRLRRICSLIR